MDSMTTILPGSLKFDHRWLTPASHEKTAKWTCYCSKCTCLLWQPDSVADSRGPWMAVGPDECCHIVCQACWTTDVTKCPLCRRPVTERRSLPHLTERVRELHARCGFPGCEVTNLELRQEWIRHRATHQSADKKLDEIRKSDVDAPKSIGPPGGPPADLVAPSPTPGDRADSKAIASKPQSVMTEPAPPTYEQAVGSEPPSYEDSATMDAAGDHKHETSASMPVNHGDDASRATEPFRHDWKRWDEWLVRRQRQVDAIKANPFDWTTVSTKCVKMQDTNDSPNGRVSALDKVLADRHDLLPVTKEPVESDWCDFIGLTTSFNHLVLHVDTLRLVVPDKHTPPISAALANWRTTLRLPSGLDEKQFALLERDGHVKCNNVQSFQMVWENDKDRLAWIKSVYILGSSYVVYGGQAKRAGRSSNGSRLVCVRNPYFFQLPDEPTA